MKGHLFVFIFALFLITCNSQDLDSFCTLSSSGGAGKCLLLSNCPKAVEDLQKRQIFPQTCGYQGTQPIVCCEVREEAPVTPTTPTRETLIPPTPTQPIVSNRGPTNAVGEVSKQKCREYGEYVFEYQKSVVLLPGSKRVRIDRCAVKSIPQVVGGEDAEPREFPHMALLGFDINGTKAWLCGGSLISRQFVLTAGHCLYFEKRYVKYVRLGDLNIASTTDDAQPQEFNVAQTIYNPDYSPPSIYNDIALLKLDRPAELNIYVRPACLYTEPELRTQRALATGWGLTAYEGSRSNHLQKVILEYFTHEECRNAFNDVPKFKLRTGVKEESQLCAGSHTERKDTCKGDSGGPLQINSDVYCMYEIVGITSIGKACGIINKPAVYTRVSRYIDWIEGIVWGS